MQLRSVKNREGVFPSPPAPLFRGKCSLVPKGEGKFNR